MRTGLSSIPAPPNYYHVRKARKSSIFNIKRRDYALFARFYYVYLIKSHSSTIKISIFAKLNFYSLPQCTAKLSPQKAIFLKSHTRNGNKPATLNNKLSNSNSIIIDIHYTTTIYNNFDNFGNFRQFSDNFTPNWLMIRSLSTPKINLLRQKLQAESPHKIIFRVIRQLIHKATYSSRSQQ